MIYLRVRRRVLAKADETLRLKDVAGFLADARCGLNEMRVILPKGAGVWPLDALQLIMQIKEVHPDETINVLGDGIGWLHRESMRKECKRRERYSFSRIAIALFSLSVIGALLIMLFQMGHDENRRYLIVMPYMACSLLGAAAYFSRTTLKRAFLFNRLKRAAKNDSDAANASQSDKRRDKNTIAKRGK